MESLGEYNVRGSLKRYKNITSDDAYLLGYMACDGGFVVNRGFPFMMVSSTESYIIQEFKNVYLPDASIYNVGIKSSEKVNATNCVYELRWPGKASKQFSKFGVFCKKIERRLVGIPKSKMHEYMAGVIEADGFITVSHRKDCRTPRLRWFVTHQSEMFLSDLQKWLPIPTTLRQHGDNVWRLQAQDTEKNKEFLSLVLPHMLNHKKRNIVYNYLKKYYVPQASDELREPTGNPQPSHIDVEGSETR